MFCAGMVDILSVVFAFNEDLAYKPEIEDFPDTEDAIENDRGGSVDLSYC